MFKNRVVDVGGPKPTLGPSVMGKSQCLVLKKLQWEVLG